MSSQDKSSCRHDLLAEPILRWRTASGVRDGSLPDLLAALVRREVRGFPRVRAHQAHPWHAFLVQIAALALRDRPDAPLPDDPVVWTELLVELAEGQREAWCLLVEDVTRPAFLQPPRPRTLSQPRKMGKGTRFETPAMIDTLKVGRNHDLKTELIGDFAMEHWVQALVSTQTCGGFEGRGVYGVVRMNGGFASRGAVAAAPSLDPSSRFLHDVPLLRRFHDDVAERYLFNRVGCRLLWLLPWDPTSSNDQVPLADCDPWFVEIGRVMRLVEEAGSVVAHRWPTSAQRVAGAAEARGVLGDPWLPVILEGDDAKAMSVSGKGFGYEVVARLLLDRSTSRLPLCADGGRFHDDDEVVVFQGLARGQGGTSGYHERVVHVPRRIRLAFFSRPDARDRLHQLASSRIKDVATLRTRVLWPALKALVGSSEPVHPLLHGYERRVDDLFFERLWADAELEPAVAKTRWLEVVEPMAREILYAAPGMLAVPVARRFQLISSSRRIYWSMLAKAFPDHVAAMNNPPQSQEAAS